MKKFRKYLRRKHSANTVNNTMNSLYSMLKEIRKLDPQNYRDLHVEDLRLKPLKVTDVQNTGEISWHESQQMIDYLKNLPTRRLPKQKATLFHIARQTGIRKGNKKDEIGLLGLKFKDLKYENDMYVLYYKIKGKQSYMAIKDEDAQILLDLKESDDQEEFIFKLSDKTVERTMAELQKVLEIDEGRNISFHSLRKLSGIETYEATGRDIEATKNHLDHNSIETTKTYIQRTENLQNSPSLIIGQDLDCDELDGLTMEQIKELFNNISRSAQYEILNKKKEMGL